MSMSLRAHKARPARQVLTAVTSGLIGLLIIFGTGCAMAEISKIEWTALPEPESGVDAIRLVAGQQGLSALVSRTQPAAVLGATTRFWSQRLGESPAKWTAAGVVNQILPVQPQWDAGVNADGQLQIVLERAGGATNTLALLGVNGSLTALTGEHPLKSFSAPRFAGGEGNTPKWLTAVADKRLCMVFALQPPAAARTLGECSGGVLVKQGAAYAFVYKAEVPGFVRGNAIAPGRLYLLRMDAAFKPVTPAVAVLNETAYEFDATMVRERLVIAATTAKGITVVFESGRPGDARLARQDHAASTNLTSLSIAAGAANDLTVAAMDLREAGPAKAYITRIALPAPLQ